MLMRRSLLPVIAAASLSAGLMYFLDPDRGQKRRRAVRELTQSRLDNLSRGMRSVNSGLRERADQLVERGKSLLTDELPGEVSTLTHNLQGRADELVERGRTLASRRKQMAADRRLEKQARAAVRRLTRHPKALQIEAHEGRLTLSGSVLEKDEHRLVKALSRLPGVDGVDNLLDVYRDPRYLSERRSRNRTSLLRLLTAAGGGLLWWYGRRTGGQLGNFAKVAGLGLATRGLTRALNSA